MNPHLFVLLPAKILWSHTWRNESPQLPFLLVRSVTFHSRRRLCALGWIETILCAFHPNKSSIEWLFWLRVVRTVRFQFERCWLHYAYNTWLIYHDRRGVSSGQLLIGWYDFFRGRGIFLEAGRHRPGFYEFVYKYEIKFYSEYREMWFNELKSRGRDSSRLYITYFFNTSNIYGALNSSGYLNIQFQWDFDLF